MRDPFQSNRKRKRRLRLIEVDAWIDSALFKLGLSAAETGDSAKSRKYLKRVIEEYSTSDEAKLAKAKMAEIR